MKLAIEESVLRQALEALDVRATSTERATAITALRTALDAAEKVEEQLATVTKERDELVADAKRYRYIQRTIDIGDGFPPDVQDAYFNEDVNAFDLAIDAALAKVGADKTGDV